MYLEDTAVAQPRIGKTTLLPALICAGLCVAMMRVDFLTIFFLVPLGFCSIVYGTVAVWLGFVFAVLGHSVLSIGLAWYGGTGLADIGLDILHFTVLVLGFVWIMAGNPPESSRPDGLRIPAIPRIRTVFRFTAASIAAALVFLSAIFAASDEGGFVLSRSQIEAIASAYIASSGADAAQQAFLERMLTPDRIIETLTAIILRGGALFSAFFVFFFSRQAAGLLVRLIKRQERSAGTLPGFYVPRKTIWTLSLCLPVILLCRAISLHIIEIAAWNVLVICVIMFLAQGSGIVLYNLARRHIPWPMRLLCGMLCVILVFSPGINMMAMGALVLLGIAETWLPLRKVKENSVN